MPSGKVVKFNVWPARGKKPWFWKVFVFEDRKAMLAFWEQQCKNQGRTYAEDFHALTTTWEIITWTGKTPRRGWRAHCIGHILFHRHHLGAGTVAHEMGHAALRWAETWLKIPVDDLYGDQAGKLHEASEGEEEMLHVLGTLVSQFWRGFYRLAPKAWYVR